MQPDEVANEERQRPDTVGQASGPSEPADLSAIEGLPPEALATLTRIAHYAFERGWFVQTQPLLQALRPLVGHAEVIDVCLAVCAYMSGDHTRGLREIERAVHKHAHQPVAAEVHAAVLLLDRKFDQCRRTLDNIERSGPLGAVGRQVRQGLAQGVDGQGRAVLFDLIRRRSNARH